MAAVVGSLFCVVINWALGYAALLAAWRLLPTARLATRFVAATVLYLAGALAIAQLLSPFSLYTRGAVAAITLLAAAAAHVAFRSHRNPQPGSLRPTWLAGNSVQELVLPCLCITPLLLTALRAFEYPPLSWDSLTYHLPFAAKYVQAGRLVAIDGPSAMDVYAHAPKNAEILASWLLLPFHGDLIVGLLSLVLLAVGWVAVYAFGQELELEDADAALAATAICSAPFLFNFVTTQNSDTLVFAVLLAAALFLTRYLAQGRGADAFLTCISAAIAIGAKYTALALSALLLACVCSVAAYRLLRAGSAKKLSVWALLAALALVVVGSRQYVLNTLDTGNPLYPLSVSVHGHELLRGSPYDTQLVAEKGTGNRHMDWVELVDSFNYFPSWRTPTSAGPKFIMLMPLALLALLLPRGRRARTLQFMVAAALLSIAATYAPTTGFAAMSRRFWPGSAPRFIAAPLGILTVAAFAWASHLAPSKRQAVRALVLCFVVWDVAMAHTTVIESAPLLGGIVLAIALLAIIAWRGSRRLTSLLAIAGVMLLVLVGSRGLTRRRAASRWHYYATATDVPNIPRDFVGGWEYLDRIVPGATIALTAGWDDAGQNFFFYPLMGSRLQNTVTYVPLNNERPGSPDFVRREHGDPAEWEAGLRSRHVTHVFVEHPWPIEDEWMRTRAERFTLVNEAAGYRIYSVHPAQPLARNP